MKILQVINCFARSGGAEKFTFDLSLALKNRGNDVEVLSLIAPPVKNREFLEKASSQGIKVHILTKGSVYSLKNIVKLHRFFKVHSYDVIQVHLFPALYFCAVLKNKRMRMVFTEHSTDNRRRHNKILRIIDKYIYGQYNEIICISEKVREALFQSVGQLPTVVIPNGIRLMEFYDAIPLSQQGLISSNENKKIRIVTMCARFFEGKDYKTLFRALNFLPSDIHVLCVGDGKLKAEHEQYCKQQEWADRVHFLGLREDVNRIYKSSEVIVLSSKYEGFSISMLEAMASGKSFIGSEVPGIADLVKGYAVLFPYGDEQALAECILRLLKNEVYRESVIRKCKEFSSRYNIETSADKYIGLYQSLFSK